MYPLLLNAPVKDYIWGGTRLIEEYGFKADSEKVAEAWVLSCHKNGASVIKNGDLAGKTLPEVLENWGTAALGKNAEKFSYFPVLIKLIDAKDKLSVQVHPDNEYALKTEGEYGKTEMWYIVDCEEGAQLIYGLNSNVTKEEFERRISDNTLTDICNFVPVKKGDVFFISAGTLHAIGKGILIAEIQQNSDTTYRVSDYGRLGADGKPRPLHIEKAKEVTNLYPATEPYGNVGELTRYPFGTVRQLASCDMFQVDLLNIDGNIDLYKKDTFVSLLVLEGNLTVSYPSDNISAKKGDSIFIPAGMHVRICGKAEAICSYI